MPAALSQNFGITPADAGKTVKIHDSERKPQDHPRGCGENPQPQPMTRWTKGSPPRMRGKPPGKCKLFELRGITPADAGKTFSHTTLPHSGQDHPRGCGENVRAVTALSAHAGSPPRMRGKLSNCSTYVEYERITPADAGKTAAKP